MCDSRSFPQHFVYKYTDTASGRVVYVGKTNASLKHRIDAHRTDARFAPYLGSCSVLCAAFPSSSEVDAVEMSLIGELRPVLNTACSTLRLPDELPTDAEIDWELYEDVAAWARPNKRREAALRKAALADEALLGEVVRAICTEGKGNGDEIVVSRLHPTGVLPIDGGHIRVTGAEVRKVHGGYAQVIEVPDGFDFLIDRVSYSIWLPIAQVHEFSDSEASEFDALSRLSDFAFRVRRAYDSGQDVLVIGKDAAFVVDVWRGVFERMRWTDGGLCEATLAKDGRRRIDEELEKIAGMGLEFFRRSGVMDERQKKGGRR